MAMESAVDDMVKVKLNLDRELAKKEAEQALEAKHGKELNFLGWTKAEVIEFQDIWKSMKMLTSGGMGDLGVAILLWILDNMPSVKKLFTVFDPRRPYTTKDSKAVDENFMKHARNIVHDLDKIIRSLDNPEYALQKIRMLARLHVHRKVKSELFKEFRDKFHFIIFDLTRAGKGSRTNILWYQFLDGLYIVLKQEEEAILRPRVCCAIL